MAGAGSYLPLQSAGKLLFADPCLPKNAAQGTLVHFAVHRNHADAAAARHDQVTAALPPALKTQPIERPGHPLAGHTR
jgi:hypothetical protein